MQLILLLILVLLLYKMLSIVVARIKSITIISKLKKECGAKITYTRPPLASLFFASKSPCETVETDAAIYAVRFISSGGGHRYMHIAREDFVVTYRKSYFTLLEIFSSRRYRMRASASRADTASRSVKIMPPITLSEDILNHAKSVGKPIIKAVILSPTPLELTYVTSARTSIKLAFSGDEINGVKFFTARNFATYAEREHRNAKRTKLN